MDNQNLQVKNIVAFKKLLKDKGKSFKSPKVYSYIPHPTDMDYKIGNIERYFVQRINDKNSEIIEIDKKSLNSLIESNYYRHVKINWVIKGKEIDIKKLNKKSINNVYNEMPRLSLYLPNLVQFAKIEEFG